MYLQLLWKVPRTQYRINLKIKVNINIYENSIARDNENDVMSVALYDMTFMDVYMDLE